MKTIYTLFSALLLWGCSEQGEIGRALDRADMIVREDPAYAQVVLDSLYAAAPSLMDDETTRARYIVLNEYAKYRNGIDEKNDSLISIAEEYIMQNGTNRERMLCLFVQGRTYFTRYIYGPAMQKYGLAAEYAKACSDHFMLGQIYTNQYLICSEMHSADGVKFAQRAAEEYALTGDSIFMMDGETNLGICYYYKGQFEKSDSCLNSALQTAMAQRDTFAIQKCVRFLAYLYNRKGDSSTADSLFHQLFDTYHDKWFLEDYAILSEVHAQKQQFDSAMYYLSKARRVHYSSIPALLQYLKSATCVYTQMADYEEASRYSEEYRQVSDSVNWNYLCNSVMREQYATVQQKLSNSESKIGYLIWIIGVLMVCIVPLGTWNYIVNLRKKAAQEKLRHLEEEKKLRDENYTQSVRLMKQSNIVHRLKEASTSGTSVSAAMWQELDSLFLEMLPDFEQRIKSADAISDQEWRLAQLIKLGFSTDEIATLTNHASSSISSSCNRLAKRLIGENAGAKEWREYVQNL